MTSSLTLHIGMGKTGTSSIQAALKLNPDLLEAKKIRYMGLMLENLPNQLFRWQDVRGYPIFLRLNPDMQQRQIVKVLKPILLGGDDGNNYRFIWSNEMMFGRHKSFVPAMKELERQGINIDIICYLREHGAWSRSAYEQWSLKHKNYEGKIMSYREYFKKFPIAYYPSLALWLDAFPGKCKVRNFDCSGDVVLDFFRCIGIEEPINYPRRNEQLSPEEMLIRSVFNNMCQAETKPFEFNQLMTSKGTDLSFDAMEWMESLLPDDAMIDEVRTSSAQDLEDVNSILLEQGQPPLSAYSSSIKKPVWRQSVINTIMLQLIVIQARKIQQLQARLDQLA